MKGLLTISFLIIIKVSLYSQNDTLIKIDLIQNQFESIINKKLVYPDIAKEMGIEGQVIVSFWITTNGCIQSLEIKESPNINLSKAVISALQNTKCNWEISYLKEKPVSVQVSFPVNFSLGERRRLKGEFFSLENALQSNEKVEFLVLKKQNYNKIPERVYEFKSLYRLDLTSNNITEVPQEIAEFKNLGYLILSNNKLKKISSEIENLKKLYKLNLSYNSLNFIPEEVFKLSKLSELDLKGNNIKNIPIDITKMKKLHTLNISSNILNKIPENIFKMVDLIELDLSDNNLTELPENITLMNNLRRLKIENNSITTFPESISKTKIVVLSLKGNDISSEEIKRLKMLLPNARIEY